MSERRHDDASDTALVLAARKDPAAFCAFYDRNARPLLGWLVAQTGDAHAATDLLAETFAVALRSLTAFRGERPTSGRAWLFGIALRLLLRYRETTRLERRTRGRLGLRREPYLAEGEVLEERLLAEALRPELERALAGLPDHQRQALQLRIVDELNYEEVAVRLDTTPVAVRLRVSRALKALRRSLEGSQA